MKIKFSKKTKRITIISLSTLLLAAPIVTAASISYTQLMSSNTLNLNNDNFNYVINNADKITTKTETTNSKWSIEEFNSSSSTYFNSPVEMQKYATSKYIKQINAKSSYELSNYTDPLTGILGNHENGDSIWKNISLEDNPDIKKVYKGVGDQIFESETEAKKSFEQIYEAYYFNGIYFNTKEELKKYLFDEYFLNNSSKYNSIIIKAPNGNTSYSIKVDDPNLDNLVNSFVADNVNTVIQYDKSIKQGNDEIVKGDSYYFTKENYKNNISEINTLDLKGQKMYSNQNKSQYILDTSYEDAHTLYAPYFYEGTLDIGSFSNLENWQKVENNQELGQYKVGLVNDTITSFFDLLLNENNQSLYTQIKNNPNNLKLFNMENIKVQKDDKTTWDDFYISEIKKNNDKLYNGILNTYLNLLRGKRYNSFYKIPIMYKYIMQTIIREGLSQYLLDLTVQYFSNICDYLQDIINSLTPNKEILNNVNKKGNSFNLKNFFNIGNSQYNLNSSIESYIETLKLDYPMLAVLFLTISSAVNDSNSYFGLFNTFDYFINLLSGYNFLSGANKILFNNLKNEFNNIYDLFITSNEVKFFQKYKEYCQLNFDINNESFNKNQALEVLFQSSQNYSIGTENTLIDDLETYNGSNSADLSIRKMLGYKFSNNTNINNIDPLLTYSHYFKDQGDIIKQIAKEGTYSIAQIYFLLLSDFVNSKGLNLKLSGENSIIEIVGKFNNLKNRLQNNLTNDYKKYSKENQGINQRIYSLISTNPEKFLDDSFKNLYSKNNDALKAIYETSKNVLDIITSFKGIAKDIVKASVSIQSALKTVEPFIDLILAFIPSETKFYYVYTTLNNDKFIWDGGRESTSFYGLIPISQTTSKDMQLISPIQYVYGQIEDFFYYDQKKYFNYDELATIQMQHMFNQLNSDEPKFPSKAFSYKYTFDKIPLDNNPLINPINSSIKSFDSLDQVKKYVLDTIKNDININNGNGKYLSDKLFAFSNGALVSSDDAKNNVMVNNIIQNIRPTYIALKPQFDANGFAINNEKDFFILPNKSWTASSGLYENKIIDISRYIIDDSANELKPNQKLPDDELLNANFYVESSQIQASDNSKAKVSNLLNQQVNVHQKTILSSEFFDKNNFNDLNDNVYSQSLYQVKLPNQIIEYFTDIASAQRWMAKNLNMKKVFDYKINETYTFNGITFNSIDELRVWVNNNQDLINQMRGI